MGRLLRLGHHVVESRPRIRQIVLGDVGQTRVEVEATQRIVQLSGELTHAIE